MGTTAENMNMISMLEKAICSTLRIRMRKFDNSWKNFLGKPHLKKLSCKNRLLGQNSMSLPPTCITWHQPGQFRVCTIHRTLSWNHKHSMSILKRTCRVRSKQTIIGSQRVKKRLNSSASLAKNNRGKWRRWGWLLDDNELFENQCNLWFSAYSK